MSLTNEAWGDSSDSQLSTSDTRTDCISDLEDQQISAEELSEFRRQYQAVKSTIKATTFEQARDLQNSVDEHVLEDYLYWQITHPNAESYSYWCSDTPSKRDFEFLTPLGGAVFYNQLNNLVQEKTQILQSPHCQHSEEQRVTLERVLDNYRQQLSHKSEIFQQKVITGEYPDKRDELFNLNGLKVSLDQQEHDLSRSYAEIVDGWLSNVVTYNHSFVEYASTEFVNQHYFQKRDGKPRRFTPATHHIYLNPDPEYAIPVAKALIERFEHPSNPLPVHMKIFNRSIEAGKKHLLLVRSEGIVIYTHEEDTNAVLEAVMRSCYMQYYLAFAQRATTKLATPVAEGIAIASQEGYNSEEISFLGHRSQLFNDAWQEFKYYREINHSATVTQQDIQVFRQCLSDVLGKNNIDPHNIAFPDDYSGSTVHLPSSTSLII